MKVSDAQLSLLGTDSTGNRRRAEHADPVQMQESLARREAARARAEARLQDGEKLDELSDEELFALPLPKDFDLHELCSTWNAESKAYSDLRFERGDW